MAMQELWNNKLRTFLSLFGITIGIFCIIGVLATVSSLKKNIQNEISSLGNNTIYIDKWDYSAGAGSDYPRWKYAKRPAPTYNELKPIKERTAAARYAAFVINSQDKVSNGSYFLSNIKLYGVSEDFDEIQNISIQTGRYITDEEFNGSHPHIVIGSEIAGKLFSGAEGAINKQLLIRGKKMLVVGVITKQGKQMIGGWDFDQSVIIPYKYARTLINESKADPVLMVQGKDNLDSKLLKEELTGTMRTLHKLKPAEENDFSLNDVNDFNTLVGSIFKGLNLGGWAIAALSLIVGMFGVANIMFVTVKERSSQIGLKKAIGAKQRVIITEFLLESAFLCIIGGIMGLALVYVLTLILTNLLNFPVFIPAIYLLLAIFICIITGIIAGIVPAMQAAKMEPVKAIKVNA